MLGLLFYKFCIGDGTILFFKILPKEGNSSHNIHVLLLWTLFNDMILLVNVINKENSIHIIPAGLLFLGYVTVG